MITLLANGVGTFFVNGKPIFVNGPRTLRRNPSDYIIFDILNGIKVWVFIEKIIEKKHS